MVLFFFVEVLVFFLVVEVVDFFLVEEVDFDGDLVLAVGGAVKVCVPEM